ncbi:MAG TPA: GAF domain-containing protein, partial [Anaerolineae bacterium]
MALRRRAGSVPSQKPRGAGAPDLAARLAAADRTRAAFDIEAAITAYSELLDAIRPYRGRDAKIIRFDALLGRAECYGKTGDPAAQLADLTRAASVAKGLHNASRQVEAACRRVTVLADLGRLVESEETARDALSLAREVSNPKAEADSLAALGLALRSSGQFADAIEFFSAALTAHRALGDRRAVAADLRSLARLDQLSGQAMTGVHERQREALALYREIGDIDGEIMTLNLLAIASDDLAQMRAYMEQALALARRSHDLSRQSLLLNSLGLLYWQLGLYYKALGFSEQAVAIARATRSRRLLVSFAETLARCQVALGLFEAAATNLEEGLGLAAGDDWNACFCHLQLGRRALISRRPEEALARFELAIGLAEQLGMAGEQPGILAWWAAAHQALGHLDEAERLTGEAVRRLETLQGVIGEFPMWEVYWWRYQALLARSEAAAARTDGAQDTDGAWAAEAGRILDRAHALMMARIATLSDEGLRRNYLNKVPVNRSIVLERNRLARARGLPPAEETGDRAGNVQDQLRRLMDIAVRMNEQHDPAALLDFILDEAIELNGAEQVGLALLDGEGRIKGYRQRGNTDDAVMLPIGIASPAAEAPAAPPQLLLALLPAVAETRRGVLRPAEGNEPAAFAVPLLAHGDLVGVLYAANRPLFGRFDAADLDLLSVFANQAGTALDNAHLYQDMEGRVAERTAELAVSNAALSDRAAELEVIASLQHGLATGLDFQAMIDLTGEKLRAVFNTGDLTVSWYEEKTGLLHYPYCYEHGERQVIPARPPTPGGLFERISKTRETIVANNPAEYARAHVPQIPDTDQSKSLAAVPVISGDRVLGLVVMEDYEREEAYGGPEVRLLTTIASSLGSALQNAHLFDETQRLLAETEQRVAELATVNAVSQAVTSEVDLLALIHLIGEQVRSIFKADIAYVALHDQAAGMINFLYQFGEEMPSFPYGQGLTSQIIATAQPVLLNQNLKAQYVAPGSPLIGRSVSSYLGVPILARNRAIGVISVQSLEEEGRFDDNDVRLLSTIAANVGAALENAALFAETGRRAREMAALNE